MRYLYNGVELPALPEWDKETYPYAYLTHEAVPNGDTTIDSGYALLVLSGYRYELYSSGAWGVTKDGIAEKYKCGGVLYDENAWTHTITYEEIHTAEKRITKILWANFDVLNEDGSVYLAASDPIPVGVSTLDPQSLTAGWLVGKKIAAMRGK